MMTVMTATRMTADDVRVALRRHYGLSASDLFAEEWAVIDEVKPIGAVWAGLGTTIDMLAVRNWTGRPKGHERHAIEIKVSKADFRREMESGKWGPWAGMCHRFYFATPAGLVAVSDIPDGTGWIEVAASGCRITVRAPVNPNPGPFPESVAHELARRVSRLSERMRRVDITDPTATIARLTDEVTRLGRANALTKHRARAATTRLHDIERRLAHAVIVACVICDDRVLPHPFDATRWRHVDADGRVASWAEDRDHPATPPDEYQLTTTEGLSA